MLRLFITLIACALGLSAHAAIAVDAATSWPLRLADHATAFEHADPALQLADIRRLDDEADAFRPLAGRPLTLAATSRVAWVRVDLQNTKPAALPLRLVLGDSRVQRVDFYVLDEGTVIHSTTGSGVAIGQQAWPGRDAGVEFTLPPQGSVTIYARAQHARAAGLMPKLYTPAAYAQREQRAALWDGTLLGGLLALGWAGLLIAIFSRSSIFMWLALLCVNIALFEGTYRGYSQLYLWPEAIGWGQRSSHAVGLATSVFFALFVLGIAKHESVRLPLRRLFITAAGVQGAMAILSAAGVYYLIAGVGVYMSLAFYALGLVMALYLMRQTAPSARLMVIVMSFALFNISLRKMEALGVAPPALTQLGMDIHPNPVVALLGLATNLAVLAAWIHQVAKQRAAAQTELANWQRQEQQRLHAEVQRQTEALNQTLAYAEEKNRQQVQMLGYITHDLRAPLATIAGHARLLEQEVDQEAEHHAHAINRSVQYQLALIDDLLEFTRAELHPLRIEPRAIDLRGLLDDIGVFASTLSANHSNRYTTERRSDLPAQVRIDARRLQQVLLNLISNAAKYTRNGDIRLLIEAEPSHTGWRLRFAVADTGIGINLPHQTGVFEAYRQIQHAHGGVGLGLYIAQRIVDSMGGTLHVRSAAGQGSVFSFDVQAGRIDTDMIPAGVVTGLPLVQTREGGADAPARLRAELAILARDGRLSDIENWLVHQRETAPEWSTFFKEVEDLLQTLDFERIERFALEAHA